MVNNYKINRKNDSCFELLNNGIYDENLALEFLKADDYINIVNWNNEKSADFLYQWAGPSYDFPITEEKISQKMKDNTNCHFGNNFVFKIVNNLSGKMIGMIELARIDRNNKKATIARFLLDEIYRNKGFGQKVLKMVLQIGFEILDIEEISLCVFDFNYNAIKCYQKVGFVKRDEREIERQINGVYWNVYDMKILRKDFYENKK